LGRLPGMRTAMYAKRKIRIGQPQLRQEHLVHGIVVMLTGVNQPYRKLRAFCEGFVQGRNLHEIGPRAHHA
jgi:hypothetical protein